MSKGFCKAWRSSWTHNAFDCLLEASIWNYLYQNAFYEDGTRRMNGIDYDLKRGDILISLRFLATGFKTNKNFIAKFLKRLEDRKMISTQAGTRATIVSICNYNKYQATGTQAGTPDGTHIGTNKKEGKESNEVKKETIDERILFFDDFWDVFPRQRRGSKQNAKKAYIKAIKEKRATEQQILQGAKNYGQSDEVARGYAKGTAAWLNDNRWANDYSKKPTTAKTSYMDDLQRASIALDNKLSQDTD